MDHPYQAYRLTLPDNAIPTDTLLGGPDSLISHSIGAGSQNYTMTGSGNKVWLTTRGSELTNGSPYSVYLQELKLVSAGTKKYKFVINTTDAMGVKIGQEVQGSNTGKNITYNTPSIATDSNGHALFYVMEVSRYTRVSPITEGGILSWGAMGRPLGSGYWNGFSQNQVNPFAVLSYTGKAVVAWDNNRFTGATNTSQNIWMERVTDVFTPAYEPPLSTLQLLGTTSNETFQNFLTGSTGVWTTIQQPVYNSSSSTPVLSIMDTYPLGTVRVKIYENSGTTRVTNGLPYLNRNISIVVDNNPHGSGNIPIRFYIPQVEFDVLKASDPSILNPGDLGIIKQPNDDPTVLPSTYTVVTGEENVPLTGWGTVDGGYYIEFIATGFSNFFIAKSSTPLPLKWLDVQGRFTTPVTAAITWTVTEEHNIKGYTVQYSADGVSFSDGCVTGSTNSGVATTYTCTSTLPVAGTYYFRVRQEDIDGKTTYSKIILLNETNSAGLFTVSPNPTSNTAVLNIPAGSIVHTLTLYSSNGTAVWQKTGALNGTVTIPMARLASGVYHLQVMQDRAAVTMLTIIKK
jgi:hypothetical protein